MLSLKNFRSELGVDNQIDGLTPVKILSSNGA